MHFFISLLSPKKFLRVSTQLLPYLTMILIASLGYGLLGGLYLAPADYFQGEGYRIIYVHAPCAFLSLFIYATMALSALIYLVFRIKLASFVLKESVPLGTSFTFLALVTGSIWGKPMWGTWWIWDARLTSELILFFLYIGILLFQNSVSDKRFGSKAVAILTLVGFVDLPIIHYSVYWWNTLHQGPTLKIFSPSAIDASMYHPLLAMIVAFITYYAVILIMRMRYEISLSFEREML